MAASGTAKQRMQPYDWALRFEHVVRTAIEEDDLETVVGYEQPSA